MKTGNNCEKTSLKRKIASELKSLSKSGELLKGSVYKVSRCRNADGTQKESWMLTFKGEGNKTRSVYIKQKHLAEVRQMLENYKKAKDSIESIAAANVELLKMR